jgi:FPC/CPF motif-containing protein YcgG
VTPVELQEQCRFDFDAANVTPACSAYAQYVNGRLFHPLDPNRVVASLQEFVHDSFRALILNPHFTCVAAKGAIHRGTYRTGLYGEMASPESSVSLAHDLYAFLRDQDVMDVQAVGFSTFAASFQGPCLSDEETFERLLWKQLQNLHDGDAPNNVWDPAVSADPESRDFSFSFGGRAFYLVGMHPAASRWSRRFAWPTLVFNAHAQFDRLKADGRYQPLQHVIRARDMTLQGEINPMLGDFGQMSEARQYSGRSVGVDWRCPFHAHPGTGEDGA